MKDKVLEQLIESLAHHPARLEALAAELVRSGVLGLEDIEFTALSTFARGYNLDIGKPEIHEYPSGKILRLTAHREGIYDQLPPGFFHRPEAHKPGESLEKRLEEANFIREEEKAARRFFQPFEQEFFLYGVQIEQHEQAQIDCFDSQLKQRLLLTTWPACQDIDRSYYPLLSFILPLSYRIAGQTDLMAAAYATVLRCPVTVSYRHQEPAPSHAPVDISIGDRLGDDLSLAGSPDQDNITLNLEIGPIRREEAGDFIAGGNRFKLMALLADCLIPFEVTAVTTLVFKEEHEPFTLEKDESQQSRLGLTSRLTPYSIG